MKYLAIIFYIAAVYSAIISKDQTSFYETFIPNLNFQIESGYISISQNGWVGNTFYQFVSKTGTKFNEISPEDPVIIWVDGGPGCGSQYGLFDMNGPFIVTGNKQNTYQLSLRKESWNNFAHLLYFDSPYGAGFSYTNATKPVSTSEDTASYYAEFLIQFYQTHKYLQKNPLYIFGVSYAGHFIPSIVVELLKNQQFLTLGIELKGITIGNGWTSPIQQSAYSSAQYYSIGIVDNLRRQYIQNKISNTQTEILKGQYLQAFIVANQNQDLEANFTGNINQNNFQKYYYSDDDNQSDLFVLFLNSNKAQFDVPNNISFQHCTTQVVINFAQDLMKSKEDYLAQIIEQGIKVFLYYGQTDLRVPTAGALNWVNQMKWSKINQWKQTQKNFIQLNDDVKGWVKSYENFSFASIYLAGHLVVVDQPELTYQIMQNFINQ